MKSTARTVSLLVILLVPVFASAAYTQDVTTTYSTGWVSSFGQTTGFCTGTSIVCIASTVINLINNVLVPVLFAIAFIVFLYGIAKAYIFSTGDEEAVKSGHKIILWGVIGFVVMVSLWGLVNVVANSFGLGGGFAPTLPTSYR